MCGYPILSYFEESDRQTIGVGMRTLLFHPLVLRGRFCKRGGAGRLRLRKRNGFHRRRAGLCARSEFAGHRDFFLTMVRMLSRHIKKDPMQLHRIVFV